MLFLREENEERTLKSLSFIRDSQSTRSSPHLSRFLCAELPFFLRESVISVSDRSKRFKEKGNPILVITTVLEFHEACGIETEENDGRIEFRGSHQDDGSKEGRESEQRGRGHTASLSFGFS